MPARFWWNRATEIAERASGLSVRANPCDAFVFAEGILLLDSDDAALSSRFREYYPQQYGGALELAGHVLRCRVRGTEDDDLAVVDFDDPEPLSSFEFARAMFPHRGYVEGPAGPEGWRTVALEGHSERPLIALKGNRAIVDRSQSWQSFVANLSINRLLRLQRGLIFFHAATVAVDGKGILITGPKTAGKTTTSMTMAARGHAFLGDELAAVRNSDAMLLPMRRSASVRPGPRGDGVVFGLAAKPYPEELYPDGQNRIRVNVDEMFPEFAALPTKLTYALFLRNKGQIAAVERFTFGVTHLGLMPPLACSLWNVSGGKRLLEVARLMSNVECYFLDLGLPEPTADLIEALVRDTKG